MEINKFCLKCGAQLNDGQVFCSNCGARTDSSELASSNNDNTFPQMQPLQLHLAVGTTVLPDV